MHAHTQILNIQSTVALLCLYLYPKVNNGKSLADLQQPPPAAQTQWTH